MKLVQRIVLTKNNLLDGIAIQINVKGLIEETQLWMMIFFFQKNFRKISCTVVDS